jgi:signal peptidase I
MSAPGSARPVSGPGSARPVSGPGHARPASGSGSAYPVSGSGSARPVSGSARPVSGSGPARSAGEPIEEPLSWGRRANRFRKNMPLWQELPLLLIVAFCLAVLIRTFLFQAFFIPSGSMEHTLNIKDRVLVNKVVYDMRTPERGEIVVFRGTDRWAPEAPAPKNNGFVARLGRTLGDLVGISQPGEKDFIKRVIGLPGDIVACCDAQGRVTVNNYPLDEPYISENSPLDVEPNPTRCGSRRFGPVTIAPGNMFVMGDHRLVSQDARCQGQVPIANVIGKAFVIVWPSGRWNTLGTPSTFSHIPKPAAAGPALSPGVSRSGVPSGGSRAGAGGTVGDQLAIVLLMPILVGSTGTARYRPGRRLRGRRLRA